MAAISSGKDGCPRTVIRGHLIAAKVIFRAQGRFKSSKSIVTGVVALILWGTCAVM